VVELSLKRCKPLMMIVRARSEAARYGSAVLVTVDNPALLKV
jgi:hypothetical protein